MGGSKWLALAALIDRSTKFLVDECLSPELTGIVKDNYGLFAIHVPWLGKPPNGTKSWQDRDIAEVIATQDYIFVTNNRRDFVFKHYPRLIPIHNGLVIILRKSDLEGEKLMFHAAMRAIATLEDTINKLIEVAPDCSVAVTEWPDETASDPWAIDHSGDK